MKKKQVYTPLFDTEEYVPKATCLCCGKSVKETLINNDGICIECVMNNIINSDDTILKPNEKLFATFFHQYEQYLKTRPKNNALVGLVGATFGLLAATVTSLAAHDSQPHNTNSKFDYINKKIKLLRDR